MNTKVTVVATLLLCCLLGTSDAWGRHARRMRKAKLFNALCNESQDENTMSRDACYGCFYRTRSVARGFTRLAAVSSCADKYLTNPNYDHCKGYLRNATTAADAKATPRTVYCTVLECISQVNKNTLETLENVSAASSRGMSQEDMAKIRKTRAAMAIRRRLAGVKRMCEARPTHGNRFRHFRAGHMQKCSAHRNFRRNFREERNSPRNVFQFFIDEPQPRQAFRQYNRMNYRRFQNGHRQFNQ